MNFARRSFLSLVVLLATGAIAQAGMITTYADRTTFETALGGPITVETFTEVAHFPISTGILNSSTNLVVDSGPPILPGDIKPGVTYSTAIGTGFFFNIDSGGGYVGGFLDGFAQSTYANALTITFDNPVSGFGFDTNSLMGSGFDVAINFTSGPAYANNFAVAPNLGPLQFFGFTSDMGDISSVVILGKGNAIFSFALDNFTFGGSTVVPEPSSLALTAIGGLGLIGLARRRRSS